MDPRSSSEESVDENLFDESSKWNEDTPLTGSTDLQSDVSTFRHTRRRYTVLYVGMKYITILLAIFGASSLVMSLHKVRNSTRSYDYCDCGGSVAEAKSMGCEYVPLAAAWLPEKCRDRALEDEFNDAGPNGTWKYYSDKNGTRDLNVDDLGTLSDKDDVSHFYWTTRRWHITHCAYYWIKGWRTARTGIPVEPRYDSEGHIRHCLKLFLSPIDMEMIVTHQGASLISGHPAKDL